jgi:transcriptional regulator with XRE-family HTH domain
MERIRQLRKERGLSQAKLAVKADMDPATLNRLEQGKGNPNLKTLERVASALGVEVVDLLGKAPRRSSLEPSLFNGVIEDERREALYGPWLEFVNRYADRWEKRINTGDFDLGNVNEFISTVEDLMPTLHELNADEQRQLPQQPYSFGAPAAKTGVAIQRLAALINPLVEAGASKFEKSDLDRLRRKRAEQQANLDEAARRGA